MLSRQSGTLGLRLRQPEPHVHGAEEHRILARSTRLEYQARVDEGLWFYDARPRR